MSRIIFILVIFIAVAFVFSCSSDDGHDSSDDSPGLIFGTLDYGGQTYKTVKVGEKNWMAENLIYGDDDGKYDYYTALNICPTGWHLPNSDEWDELMYSLKKEEAAEFRGSYYDSWWVRNGKYCEYGRLGFLCVICLFMTPEQEDLFYETYFFAVRCVEN
ncbi:MAG: hypothetical protein FWC26_13895 [Fibromonadales bacterium]|nr:hypothetical protein [Fibromonadales bacterium]